MSTKAWASRWVLPLLFLICLSPVASGDSLTLDNAGSSLDFTDDVFVVSGAKVNGVTPQSAAFEAYALYDKNNSGGWNGGDARRRSTGTYDNGLFGLKSMSEDWGAYAGSHLVAGTRGLLEIDNVLITSTAPAPPSVISTSLNFHVSGATPHFNVQTHGLISAEFDMRIVLNGAVFNGVYRWVKSKSSPASTTVTGLGTQIAGGGFAHTFSSTITTGSVNVPVNTPFEISVEFIAKAGSGGSAGSPYAGMTFDASNTAGFLPGGSIFNLDPGYTANSGGGLIVNNAFASSGAAAVPLPSAAWLGLSLLGFLGAARRWKGRATKRA